MQLTATYKDIWVIAFPIIIGSLAQNIIGLTDMIFLGREGMVEQGACGYIQLYYLTLVTIGLGFSRGAQILIARRAGEKRYKELGQITDNLLYALMVMAVFLFVFLVVLSPYILYLFIKSPDIYNASLDYLKYRSYGIFFSYFGFVLMALYIGIGRTQVIAWVTLVLLIVNVVLNYGLIFGYMGLPKMSIAGAGLASTLAEVVATVAGILYIMYDKQLKKYELFKFKKLDVPLIKRLSVISSPLVAQFLVGMGGWFIFFSFIEKMGEEALAVSVVLKIIYTFYSIPAWGFASAANSVVSNIIGQRKYSQVLIAINRTSIMSFIFTIICTLTLVLMPESVLGLFTKEANIIEASKPVLFMLTAIILVCSVSTVIFNGIMGTGATIFSLISQTFSMFLYLAYAHLTINVLWLDLAYAWGSEFLYWVVLALIAWLYLQSGKWRHLNV